MYKRDGVVRLSQSTDPKYGVNVHNVRVESDLSEVCSAKNYQHHRDRGILSELGEDPTYASPTYPRFTVYIYMI